MQPTALLLSLVLWQAEADPQTPQSRPVLQEVKLKSGWSVLGRVVDSDARRIELEVDDLGTVTFARDQIAAMVPVADSAASRPATASAPAGDWAARDDWFALHGPEGVALGTLHLLQSVVKDDTGNPYLRLEAEWRIVIGDKPEQITQLEEASLTGAPRRLFYREVTVDPERQRATRERIVTANVVDGRLAVIETSVRGRTTREVPLLGGVTFPLLFEEQARRASAASAAQVFDPREGECVLRRTERNGPRRVLLSREPQIVYVVRHLRGVDADQEWLDERGRILRRELHGTWFVAQAANAAAARDAVSRRGPVAAAQLRSDPKAHLRFFLPHPGWRFVSEPSAAVVRAEEPVLGLAARAELLDQLPPDTTASAALAAALRALQLRAGIDPATPTRPWAEVEPGALGLELTCRGPDPRLASAAPATGDGLAPSVTVELWTRLCVLPSRSGWVVLALSGPVATRATADAELGRLVRLFEVERLAATEASARAR